MKYELRHIDITRYKIRFGTPENRHPSLIYDIMMSLFILERLANPQQTKPGRLRELHGMLNDENFISTIEDILATCSVKNRLPRLWFLKRRNQKIKYFIKVASELFAHAVVVPNGKIETPDWKKVDEFVQYLAYVKQELHIENFDNKNIFAIMQEANDICKAKRKIEKRRK